MNFIIKKTLKFKKERPGFSIILIRPWYPEHIIYKDSESHSSNCTLLIVLSSA